MEEERSFQVGVTEERETITRHNEGHAVVWRRRDVSSMEMEGGATGQSPQQHQKGGAAMISPAVSKAPASVLQPQSARLVPPYSSRLEFRLSLSLTFVSLPSVPLSLSLSQTHTHTHTLDSTLTTWLVTTCFSRYDWPQTAHSMSRR